MTHEPMTAAELMETRRMAERYGFPARAGMDP